MKNKGDDELNYARRQNLEMSKQKQEDRRRVNQEIIHSTLRALNMEKTPQLKRGTRPPQAVQ